MSDQSSEQADQERSLLSAHLKQKHGLPEIDILRLVDALKRLDREAFVAAFPEELRERARRLLGMGG